jgi:beta-phosphoglucomutase-like phosphatase (HAD superfamily)
MSPVGFGPSDINNPRNVQWGMVPESFWLTKVLIFDFDWIAREFSQAQHPMPDHETISSSIAGLKETFRILRSFEIRLAMTSNLKLATVIESLSQWNLAEDFDCIRCAEELPSLKPSPGLHINAMETLGIRPFKAVALETAPEGVQAARHAGLFCVAMKGQGLLADYELESFTGEPLIFLLEKIDRVKRRQLELS